MLASTSSRLFRFLLSLVVRLRSRFHLCAGRIALALRSWSISLWRSLLASARRRDQSRIRLYANDVPPMVANGSESRSQAVEHATHAEAIPEHKGTLATLPARSSTARWEDEPSRHQAALSSNRQIKLVAATPERASQRYKSRMVNPENNPRLDIPPGQQKLMSSLLPLAEGWKRHIHPEGVALFYHEGLRVITECDITVQTTQEEIFFCAIELIQRAIKTDGVILDELTEIVLNVAEDGSWCYYFVDHRNRLLFWVDTVGKQDLNIDLQGISEYDHIITRVYGRGTLLVCFLLASEVYRNDIESRSHCEYYPHNRTLPKGVFEDVRGMLNYAMTDMMTTDSSSSPFGQDELKAILDLVNSLKDDNKITDQYSIWVIARIMAYFTENQFLNFCGQACARLNADTPLLGKPHWNRHMTFKAVNLFLFGFPNGHAVRLQRVWVDGIIIQPRWRDFISRLTAELGRYTIFSTVMLAVNFSFLAVPGVINPAPGAIVGPTQIIIYCSVISTVASIVFSFALLNVYSNPGLLVARNALEAMWTLNQSKYGVACLAITHSLPIASLIWSIVLFTTAFTIQIFGTKQAATVATLSVECFIIVLFMIMGVKVMWLFCKDDDVDDVDTPANPSEWNLRRRWSQRDLEKCP